MNSLTTTSLSQHPLIAVFGCTGMIGTEVMRQLAPHDCSVRGILREANRTYPVPHQERPARVSYVTADHDSTEQLTRACAGADAVFLLIGTSPDQVRIESRAIEAAQRAGVRRIVKLSAPVVEEPISVEVAHWHREIEAKLEASGLEYCHLRPYAMMQNWLRNAHTIRNFGRTIGSAGEAPRNYVDCRDVAAIAVQLLLSEQPLQNDAITITGPEAITNQDMAERISCVTGSNIQYENLSREAHYHMLVTQAKLPEWLAQHIVELEELAVRIPEQGTHQAQQLLGRYPRTMDEFLQEHRAVFMHGS
ncbi:MAG: NmrA family NAD(P)-binding protein [Chloroflexota bacterium]